MDGWAPESRVRVRTTDEQGAASGGTVRPKLGATADPLTSVYAEPNERSAVAGTAWTAVYGRAHPGAGRCLRCWFLIEGQDEE